MINESFPLKAQDQMVYDKKQGHLFFERGDRLVLFPSGESECDFVLTQREVKRMATLVAKISGLKLSAKLSMDNNQLRYRFVKP